MPVRAEVVLDDQERETLERWARRPKSSQALAFRCRIVLAAADGWSSTEIAAELGTTGTTVGKWRGRFARRGLDGLHDEPRPGKPRSISDEDVERVIVKTLEEQPANATHWSTRVGCTYSILLQIDGSVCRPSLCTPGATPAAIHIFGTDGVGPCGEHLAGRGSCRARVHGMS